MKRMLVIAGLLCCWSLMAQQHIHSISELNQGAPTVNSHEGETDYSSLEVDYRTSIVLDDQILGQQMLDYARIKRLQDGSYIMFYQPLRVGYHIYCSFSDDLIHWTKGQRVFEGRKFVNADGEQDNWKYATADAVQLKNGDLLCFCIFHTQNHYGRRLDEFGVTMKRSTDGGHTWGEEQILYNTVNWEPFPLVLDDGEILVFFTDSDWDWNPNSSGCSLLRSSDSGYSWTLQKQAIRQVRAKNAQVSQRSVGTPRLNPDSTRTVFTDQMPVVRVLSGTSTSMAVMETETPDHKLSISLAWEDSKWPVTLTGNMTGPKKRINSAFSGAGPYLVQFPSGETAVSYGFAGDFAIRLGSETGEDIPSREPLFPFGNRTSRWGSMEIVDPHTMVAVVTWLYKGASVEKGRLMLTQLHLNHRVDAPLLDVKADGKNAEWESVQDALFIGSDSPAQCAFRFAHDERKLYVLAECLDPQVLSGDGLTLMFSDGRDKHSIYRAFLNVAGKPKVLPGQGCSGAVYSVKKEGYMAEFAIDLDVLPIARDGAVYFDAVLYKGDITDTFTNVEPTDVKKWIPIVLK